VQTELTLNGIEVNVNKHLPVSLILAALLLAGCKFQAVTSIGPGGSGELCTEVGFSAEERENLENQSEGDAATDFCNTVGAAQGTTVTEQQRGGETWCVTSMSFENLDELRRSYEQKQGLHVNRLEIADGTLFYDIDMDTSSETSSFSSFESITWTLILPGPPDSHNADQLDGNTLIWTPAPASGTINLRAESESAQPQGMLALALGILALGALIVVIGFALRSLFAPLKKET
jgi:hypothetical protein